MNQNTQLNHQQVKKKPKKFPLCILANDIKIAGNVGSLFRIAEAFGIEKLYLTGSTAVPPKYKIRKAARSADKKIDFTYIESAIKQVTTLQEQGYQIISLEITNTSQDIRQFILNTDKKTCLIIGSENLGVDQALLALSDYSVHISMHGENSSMNVINSCAICLYELTGRY